MLAVVLWIVRQKTQARGRQQRYQAIYGIRSPTLTAMKVIAESIARLVGKRRLSDRCEVA
jgi:hypothetical protein